MMRRNGVTASANPRNISAQKPARWIISLSGRALCAIADASTSALAAGKISSVSVANRKTDVRPRRSRQPWQDFLVSRCALSFIGGRQYQKAIGDIGALHLHTQKCLPPHMIKLCGTFVHFDAVFMAI